MCSYAETIYYSTGLLSSERLMGIVMLLRMISAVQVSLSLLVHSKIFFVSHNMSHVFESSINVGDLLE